MKIKLTLMMIILLSLGMFSACSNSDETEAMESKTRMEEMFYPKTPPFSIEDVTGYMHYYEFDQSWVIEYVVTPSIDTVLEYYPIELEEEFKVQGLKVIFSGNILEQDTITPRFAGNTLYKTELTKIEKAE